MAILSAEFIKAYRGLIGESNVPEKNQFYYIKWLNQYLDYCHTNQLNKTCPKSLIAYESQLSHKITPFMLRQAQHAVRLFFKLNQPLCSPAQIKPSQTASHSVETPQFSTAINQPELSHLEPEDTPWKKVYTNIAIEIKTRHYSPKTLKSYTAWLRRFQAFVGSKPLEKVSTLDAKNFISHLAVEHKVAASSQNQAFNALLFIFKYGLRRPLKRLDGAVRAKRKPYLPVVLSRAEIERVFAELDKPYRLIAQLLYGCGLRLNECLNLRLRDLNLDLGVLTIHDGKGQKDRTLPLPVTLRQALLEQIESVRQLHRQDQAAGSNGVFLFHQQDKKSRNASQQLIWSWLFPAKMLTDLPNGERRRYHLHETHVQKALHQAVQRAGLLKQASAHSLRHSFASHLLQAHYDIRTIQEMMGHSDVRTTMVYLQTVPSVTLKDARSPLDFTEEAFQPAWLLHTGLRQPVAIN